MASPGGSLGQGLQVFSMPYASPNKAALGQHLQHLLSTSWTPIAGVDSGEWIGWLATPLGCAVFILLILCEHSLIYLNKPL